MMVPLLMSSGALKALAFFLARHPCTPETPALLLAAEGVIFEAHEVLEDHQEPGGPCPRCGGGETQDEQDRLRFQD